MTGYTFQSLFDFTRTTSGTFVGSNGLIQTTPASVNLLTFTQEFDNAAWSKNAITVTANTTVAPDGTSTADTVTESATNDLHAAFQTSTLTALTTHTISAYVRAGTRSFAMLRVGGGGFTTGPAIKASLTGAGSTTTIEGPVVSSAITSVGGGWYRVSMTFVSTATTAGYTPQIGPHNNGSAVTYLGDGSGIFIWGAQLEAAAAASTYTRNNGGRFPPRFDYDPVTLAPKGLLIEEQRTNLFLQSNGFTNSPWALVNTGVAALPVTTANAGVSPDGTANATRLQLNCTDASSAANRSYIFQGVTILNSTAYRGSVYVKAYDASNVGKTVRIASDNLASGSVIVTLTASWQRVDWGGTSSSTSSNIIIECRGTFTTQTADVLIYGAQVEAGAFATSYIPTVASQVTRTADVCSIVAPMFSPWYNQSEGTFVASFDSYLVDLNTRSALSAYASGATSNNILLMNTQQRQFQINNAGNQADLDGGTPTSGTVTQVAGAYKVNDFALSLNGGTVVTDTSGTVPTVDTLGIGISPLSLTPINGHIRSIRYYPFRASNNQIQGLTT